MDVYYAVFLFAVSAVSLSIALYAWRLRDVQGTRPFALLMASIGWWTATYGLELAAPTLEGKLLWAKVEYVGIVLVPVAWLLFALSYTGYGARSALFHRKWGIKPRVVIALLVLPLLTLLAVWTNEAHRLIWTETRLQQVGELGVLTVKHGPLFVLHTVYAYTLLAVGTLILFRGLWRPFALYRWQAVAVALGVFTPWVANALYLFGVQPVPGLDLTPFAFAVTGLALLWGLERFQVLDLVPLARDLVVEQMREGVLVVDVRGRLVDANRRAAELLQADYRALVGRRLKEVKPELARFLPVPPSSAAGNRWEASISDKMLEVTSTPLVEAARQVVVGYVLVVRDITARKRVERALAVQTEILAHIAADAPLPRVLDMTVKALEALIPDALGAILLLDEEGQRLYHVAAPGLPPEYVQAVDGIPVGPEAGSCGTAAHFRRPVIVTDITADPVWRDYRDIALAHGLRACWSVPVFNAEREVIGTFAAYYREPRAPTEDELEVVRRMSSLVSLAVEREESRKALRRREAVLQAVAYVAEALLRAEAWEQTVGLVLAHLARAVEAERAHVFTVSTGLRGQTPATCRHTWALSATPSPGEAWSQFTFEAERLAHWADQLRRGTPVQAHAHSASEAERTFLERLSARSVVLVPIMAGETWWGFFEFETCTRPQRWSTAELDALKSAAALVGAAVRRQQLDEERQGLLREAQFLNEVTRVALKARSLDELGRAVVARVRDFFGADNCYITLWDEEGGRPIPMAASGEVPSTFYRSVPDTLRLPPDAPTMTASVLRAGRPLVVSDVFNSPYLDPRIAAQFPDRHLLAAPMTVEGRWLGAILVGFKEPRPLQSRDMQVAERAATQVALAIAKVQAAELAQRRAEEAETLRQAGTVVASTLDFEEAINRILAQLAQVVPHDSASVQLLRREDDGSLYLEIVGGWGWADTSRVLGLRFPVPGDNPNTRVVLERTPVILDDAPAAYPEFRRPPHNHIRSWLGVPLIVRGEVIGMLAVDSTLPGHFTSDHARLVAAFADQVAIAVENARLHQAVRERLQELERLHAAARELTESYKFQDVLLKLARHFAESVGGAACVIRQVDWGRRTATLVGAYRLSDGDEFTNTLSLDESPALLETVTNRVLSEHHADSPALGDRERELLRRHGVHVVLYVPLVSRGTLFGVAEIWKTGPEHTFTESERRLVETLAQYASNVLENARLYEAERRARQVTEMLREVNLLLSQHLEPDAVLQVLLQHVTRLIPCDAANVLLREGSDRVRVHTFHGYERWADVAQLKGHPLLLAEHPHLEHILTEKCSLIIPDTADYNGWVPDDPPGTTFVRSWLGVPLIAFGESIGILSLDKAEPNFFTEEHRFIAEALAAQAAVALQNARLFARVQRQAVQLRALYRAAQTLLSTLELDALLQRVLEAAVEAIPAAEKGALLLVDKETGTAAIRALYGYTDPRVATLRFAATGGYSAKAIREKKPLLIADAHSDPEIRYTGDVEEVRQIRSAIVVPLVLHGEVLGALSLDSTRLAAFTQEDLNLLETFALTATAAIRNAQRHQEVRWLAIVDPLTEVYNRRGLSELGRREVARALRFERPLAAIMFDLDHFKQVNDSFGHAIGDQVLVGIVRRVEKVLRSTDILARYGGEEFVVLLPETPVDEARAIAERIRKTVGSAPFKTDAGFIEITVSLGVAALDETCDELNLLLERADQALYRAKQTGRNRTVIWRAEHESSAQP